jgi:hypothetical protein
MMVRQKEFECRAAQSLDLGRIRVHRHPILDRLAAGCHRRSPALDLDKAEAAAAEGQVGLAYGAQIRDIDAVIQRYPKELLAFSGPNLPVVYNQGDDVRYGSPIRVQSQGS